MRLRVMNTRTHRVEPFEPRQPGLVRMYVCGPSVYDESHLGHARSYVAYDAMKRYFLSRGLRVRHVQNFTDVEENISARAAAAGRAPLDFASRLIARFFEDMDALRVLRADVYPRVSEHLPEIQEVVSALEKRGHAYRHDCGARHHTERESCDVYFDVKSIPDYGLLIGMDVEELAVERPLKESQRRDPLDFALWKSHDDWGVTWDAPWGPGRPGWHVECTAMALKHLGPGFDIHGGGLDLVFPHHESERALGEAYAGEQYCNHYLHNGFVTVGSQKMSKSLGNFVTLRDLLGRHDPEALRAFLLSRHYRAALNYDEDTLAEAERRVARWREQAARVREAARGASPADKLPPPVREARDAFWDALEDDFHFGRGLDALDRGLDAAAALADPTQAAAALAWLREAAAATGLLWGLDGPGAA